MSAATARIELSRERLRLAMDPPPEPPSPPRAHRPLIDRVLAWPILHDVLESVGHWWSSHPLRPVGLVAGEAADAVARPVAHRHPWLLVLGAAAVGGALAWGRPWRWLLRSTLFAGLAPQIAARVAGSLPIESWMTTVGAMMQSSPRRRGTSEPPPVQPSVDTPTAAAPMTAGETVP